VKSLTKKGTKAWCIASGFVASAKTCVVAQVPVLTSDSDSKRTLVAIDTTLVCAQVLLRQHTSTPSAPPRAARRNMDPDSRNTDGHTHAVRRKLTQLNNQPYLDGLKSLVDSLPPPHSLQPQLLLKPNVLKLRSQRVTSILDNFSILRSILDRHEGTIHRRWQHNKKPKQRLELLRRAWGTDMASSHRPEFEFFCKNDKWKNDNQTKVREAYLWPYINEEDPLQSRDLLSFIASRGRHHPSTFAATDLQAIYTTLIHETFLSSANLPGHVMMFTGRENAGRYGELPNVTEHPEAAVWLMVGQGSRVSDGLLVLEAQERTMSFLLACVQLILHDVEDPSQGPKQLAPTLTSDAGSEFASLVTTASRAPYLPPAQLDLDRIISLLSARRDQAANHLWSLHEDPGYYHDYVLELKEHSHEMVKPKEDAPEQGIDPNDPKQELFFWSWILRTAFATDYLQYQMYSELYAQAQSLRDMLRSSASLIDPERILPEPFMHAMLRFRYFLNETFLCLTQTTLPYTGSPLWRNRYYREVFDATSTTETLFLKQPCRMTAVQVALQDYLARFATFTDRSAANQNSTDLRAFGLQMIGITKIMDAFQNFVETTPAAKALLTPYLASSIGDLATISECLHQLELYQPWANSFDAMLTTDRARSLRSDYAERIVLVEDTVMHVLSTFNGHPRVSQLGRIGAPTKGRFAYPVWRSKNEETVRILRTAESDLDKLWNALDKRLMEKLSEKGESHLLSWLKQPHELHRTAPWVEPSTSKVHSAAMSLHKSVQELDLTRQRLTEHTISDEVLVAQTKAKVKTRGIVSTVEDEGDDHEVENAGGEDQDEDNLGVGFVDCPKFKLKERALKVFKTIFFTPSINATPGEVTWDNFLYAMK
jgi:hypothetical protein